MAVELLKLIVMVDNIATEPGLIAEHGFAVWIETENHRIVCVPKQGMRRAVDPIPENSNWRRARTRTAQRQSQPGHRAGCSDDT